MRNTLVTFSIDLPLSVEMVVLKSTSSLYDNANISMSPLLFTQNKVFESDENKTFAHALNLSEATSTLVADGFLL